MPINKYKISNLLHYQIREINGILGNYHVLVATQNDENPYYYTGYAALTLSEIDILTELGFCVTKHMTIGEGEL